MELTFRKGTEADIEPFVCFLDDVKRGMNHRSWLYLDPPEVVREMVSDRTMEFWLALDEEYIAAVFSVLYPGLDGYNYGYDLGLSEQELRQVIHMDTAAVHPDYRGHGLQARMVNLAESALSGKGKKILLCTVHPDNRYSLNNMLSQGYEIQMCIHKYGSERYILRKNIF